MYNNPQKKCETISEVLKYISADTPFGLWGSFSRFLLVVSQESGAKLCSGSRIILIIGCMR